MTARLATRMLVILVPPTLAVAAVPAPPVVLAVTGAESLDSGPTQTVSSAGACVAPAVYDDVVPVVLVAINGPRGLVSVAVATRFAHVARDLCGLTLATSEVRSLLVAGTTSRTSVVSSARSPANRGCCSRQSIAEDSTLRTH